MPQETVETYQNGVLVSTRQEEIPQEAVNRRTVYDKARQALTANAAFLALSTPTTAQTLAHVRALTRQNNALIRLLLNELADVGDT
jgi:hypothetical protein